MSGRWFEERRREPYSRQARKEGYRARSAYKLQQIQSRMRVVRKGDTVVDLGAAPGGWSQVAVALVGPEGRVVGVDLEPVDPLPGAEFVQGDLTRSETVALVRSRLAAGGGSPEADVVLSDMSPSLSGQYSRDQAQSAWLCEHALGFAEAVLAARGNFVCKIFEGEDYPAFVARLRDRFEVVKPFRPQATRKHSSEVYLVAKGFRVRASARGA